MAMVALRSPSVVSTSSAKNGQTKSLMASWPSKCRAGRRILPIWHKDEVARYSPTLADKVALNTSLRGVEEIADYFRSDAGRNRCGQDSLIPRANIRAHKNCVPYASQAIF